MTHQDQQDATGSAFADVVPEPALMRGTPGLSAYSSIERYRMPASSLDTHVLRQHCVSIGLGAIPVDYGGRLNGKQYTSVMKPETVWFRAAGDSATCWWNRPMDGLFFSFDHDLVERLLWDQDKLQHFELVSTMQSRSDPALNHLIAALHFDTAEGHPYGVLRGEAIVSAVLTLLVTGYGAKPHRIESRSNDSPVIRRAIDYVSAHLSDPLRVTAIATAVGISPSHLHRVFRAETGVSLWSYVLQQRVRRSQVLMRTSNASLLQIALSMGFESYSQFVAAFRRETGLTPSAFRKDAGRAGSKITYLA